MINKKKYTFKNSTVNFSKDTIKWNNHLIKISDISHVWIEGNITKYFSFQYILILFFIAISNFNFIGIILSLCSLFLYLTFSFYYILNKNNKKYIHMETFSNSIYSFVSQDKNFISKAYNLIIDKIENNNISSDIQISFIGKGKIIYEPLEKETIQENKVLTISSDGTEDVLISELQKLFTSLSQKKENGNKKVLNLVKETIKSFHTNDLDKRNKLLSEFVTLELIDDCNELGLSALINSIKNSIY